MDLALSGYNFIASPYLQIHSSYCFYKIFALLSLTHYYDSVLVWFDLIHKHFFPGLLYYTFQVPKWLIKFFFFYLKMKTSSNMPKFLNCASLNNTVPWGTNMFQREGRHYCQINLRKRVKKLKLVQWFFFKNLVLFLNFSELLMKCAVCFSKK